MLYYQYIWLQSELLPLCSFKLNRNSQLTSVLPVFTSLTFQVTYKPPVVMTSLVTPFVHGWEQDFTRAEESTTAAGDTRRGMSSGSSFIYRNLTTQENSSQTHSKTGYVHQIFTDSILSFSYWLLLLTIRSTQWFVLCTETTNLAVNKYMYSILTDTQQITWFLK